ncbi:BatD family protein [Croceivirga radicis]|uniref:BatD family protein n=1 Tax=Croceivirga radicis TaxID=1929488 RepID=UPI000255B713|nr:BatD family protein [Croceivirga radicis]
MKTVFLHKINKLYQGSLLLFALLFSLFASSQENTTVKAEIDTTQIKIGEQIKYTITVETDSLNVVYFPEDQTFSPLEMVEALKIDTTKNKDRITLQRIYALTQFDSGSYTIPPQRIAIDEQPFMTDSFAVKVGDIAVDTTKQKMYDIKALVPVEKQRGKLVKIILLAFLVLLIIAGLLYYFVVRNKPLSEEEKIALLPPYERAIKQLHELENSRYLIQDEYKKYYSELTDIVRSYLEEDVHISALESTTDQLLERLELLKDAGELSLDDETLEQFKKVFKTADLVKFAKSKPPISVAEDDRKAVEKIVIKTKEALPEPTEEELLSNEDYLEELQAKKQKKRLLIAGGVLAGIIVLGTSVSIAYFGFKTVKDTVFGYPTKTLLEGEWVKSEYGFPILLLETPEVLVRKETATPDEQAEQIENAQTFDYGSITDKLYIRANVTTFKEKKEVDAEATVTAILKDLERKGVKNIIPKQDEFYTNSGKPGAKIYGSGLYTKEGETEGKRIKYTVILFAGNGFIQQLFVTWEEGDEYAEQIVQRILATVDTNTQG